MWQLFEPVHDVTYFCAEPRSAGNALGFRGFWMAYFAFRSAPLGPCEPAVVAATFYGFHESRVRRALPAAWSFATAADAIAARQASAASALNRIRQEAGIADEEIAPVAQDLWDISQRCSDYGRPLGAANRALGRPADPVERLWQAATTLREHRGDGHIAVLVARVISPVEAHLLKSRSGESDEPSLQSGRGWPEQEWTAAEECLTRAGLLHEGRLTDRGRREHDEVERATDACALQPWVGLPEARLDRLRERLEPLTQAVHESGELPALNPVGLGTGPEADAWTHRPVVPSRRGAKRSLLARCRHSWPLGGALTPYTGVRAWVCAHELMIRPRAPVMWLGWIVAAAARSGQTGA